VNEEVEKFIAAHTDDLASEYGIDDKDRVRRILERTAIDLEGGPVREDSDVPLIFSPFLYEALQYLPPEDALRIFESVDLSILSKRCDAFWQLGSQLVPFYTLSEFADVAEKFVTHQQRNRDSLLKTGCPATSFKKSWWFDHNFGGLYFTKLPVSLQGNRSPLAQLVAETDGSAERDAEGNLIYSHSWTDKCPLGGALQWRNKVPLLEQVNTSEVSLSPVRFCAYEDAPVIEGLPLTIARKLEKGREKFLKLKIDYIRTLIRCIRSPEKRKDIWTESVKTLRRAFTLEELSFYVKADFLYEKIGVREHIESHCGVLPPRHLWGGMTYLIHYLANSLEKEIAIGTYDRTKSAIVSLLPDSGVVGYSDFKSYYQIIGKPFQSGFDRALDRFEELRNQERDFFMRFGERIGTTLSTGFDTKVKVSPMIVKSEFAQSFKELVQNFAAWQAIHLRETGRFASVDGSLQRGRMTAVLSDTQEKDYDEHGYKCRDRVCIPGDVPVNRSNRIEVNGNDIRIGDSVFALFLRLVLELKRRKGGWVDRYTLQSEGIVTDPENFQIYSNLRTALKGSLLGKEDGQKFIENDGSKRYRISTHPDFITYDKKKLLNHPDYRVKRVAGKLPRR